jgi:DNA ligase (NAD+)
MNKIQQIKELTKQLNQYRNEYYNQNKPSVPDSTYDKLFDELSLLEKETNFILSNSPTQSVGYSVVSKLQKVTHKIPLLSLDKTKSIDELNKWRNNKDILLMFKGDGLTIEVDYENGQLIEASTRGNGEIGEDVTHNVISSFKNLPTSISFTGKLRLAGEAIIHWNDFNEINSQIAEEEKKYKTPRNLVSGSVRQLDSKICAKRNVYFYAFNILECSENLSDSKYKNLEWLMELGLPTIDFYWLKGNDFDNELINAHINRIKGDAEHSSIPIDGIVATYDSIKYSNSLGQTSHHPLHSIAYKFKDETEDSVLRQVEWNTTRSGQVNPTAIFDTVELDNTEVSRASLFNLTFIRDLRLNIDCRIKVSKRNMIIPYIEENLDTNLGVLEFPKQCPSCGGKTVIKNTGTADFLYCTNENCPAQLLDKFTHFVSRDAMNIDGLSEATLEKFINKRFIKTFSDIYKLEQYKSDIVQMDGFGIKSYNKLIEAIEKSKNVKFENFVYALGIDQIGKGGAKRLAKHFNNDINRFFDSTNSYDEFLQIEDFGDVTAQAIYNYFQNEDNLNQVDELLDFYIKVIKPEESKSINTNQDLTGKTFVVTGSVTTYRNRNELEDLIISLNGKLAGSVSKNTTYLINNDITSTSGKNQKANELGVPIISEAEFNQMIGREV